MATDGVLEGGIQAKSSVTGSCGGQYLNLIPFMVIGRVIIVYGPSVPVPRLTLHWLYFLVAIRLLEFRAFLTLPQ